MKTKFIICFALVSYLGIAQSSGETKLESNLSKFSARSGQLLSKEYKTVGVVKEITIQIVTLTDLSKKDSIKAVRFEMFVSGKYTSDTKIGTVDSDELKEMIESLDFMLNKTMLTNPKAYTEVIYSTRAGFQVGCYYSMSDKAWKGYIKLEKFDSRSSEFLSRAELISLKEQLQKIKEQI